MSESCTINFVCRSVHHQTLISLTARPIVLGRSLCVRRHKNESQGYVYVLVGTRWTPLHRFLLLGSTTPPAMEVDHVNGNRLDNRYCNLRTCTRSQNQQNRGKPQLSSRAASSQFKGVRRHRASGKWAAQIGTNSKNRHLGLFKTEREAALAYDHAAVLLFGPFARLNFCQQSPL